MKKMLITVFSNFLCSGGVCVCVCVCVCVRVCVCVQFLWSSQYHSTGDPVAVILFSLLASGICSHSSENHPQ